MAQDLIQDFSELYRAAYAERDNARKLMLLKEVQRRIRLCAEGEPFLDVSRVPTKHPRDEAEVGKAA